MNNYFNNALQQQTPQLLEQQRLMEQERIITQQFLETEEGKQADAEFIAKKQAWYRKQQGQIDPLKVDGLETKVSNVENQISELTNMVATLINQKGATNGNSNNKR